MFVPRRKGLVQLEPLSGRCHPVRPKYSIDWGVQLGDLQDVRNRKGLLVPPSLRFMDTEMLQGFPMQREHKEDILRYLQNVFERRVACSRPYYRDPYGRDRGGGPEILAINYNQGRRLPPPHRPGDKATGSLNARMQQLRDAMDEAAVRREAQRMEDGKIWGREKDFFADVRKLSVPTKEISPHLYMPKSVKKKSEWTKKMEVAIVHSRKKDLLDLTVRRLEDHDRHGGLTRMQKTDRDGNAVSKMMSSLNLKRERHLKAMSKLKEKAPQAP